MASDLPYLPSYKNVERLFLSIATAKQPEAFTNKFLYDMLGLKATSDRPLIALLKTLGFVDGSGKPTTTYSILKNPEKAPYAIGEAVKKAYEPLFAANEKANELTGENLKGLIAQVAGTDTQMTQKIVGTFSALVKLSKFDKIDSKPLPETKLPEVEIEKYNQKSLRPEFHYNIQIHLPTNATEETYLNIFNSLRKVFE